MVRLAVKINTSTKQYVFSIASFLFESGGKDDG